MTYCELHQGDSRRLLGGFLDGDFDSIVTDPPYELGFMGRAWDRSGVAFDVGLWRETLRVAKPGAHLIAFGGSRTYHRMACAIEDAGWEIRDQLQWIYGQGFPKSHNLRGEHEGKGTALKPAHEPIVLARKPLVGTVADNVAAHGTGALNIDASRIGNTEAGRWPANVLLDEEAAGALDVQSGMLRSNSGGILHRAGKRGVTFGKFAGGPCSTGRSDSGGASRFFYVAKPSPSERDAGLQDFRVCPGTQWDPTSAKGRDHQKRGWGSKRNIHPTVKPIALMRHLVRLVTPAGGHVLDPFLGSGTTGIAAGLENMRFTGIDQDATFVALAKARIRHWTTEATHG